MIFASKCAIFGAKIQMTHLGYFNDFLNSRFNYNQNTTQKMNDQRTGARCDNRFFHSKWGINGISNLHNLQLFAINHQPTDQKIGYNILTLGGHVRYGDQSSKPNRLTIPSKKSPMSGKTFTDMENVNQTHKSVIIAEFIVSRYFSIQLDIFYVSRYFLCFRYFLCIFYVYIFHLSRYFLLFQNFFMRLGCLDIFMYVDMYY